MMLSALFLFPLLALIIGAQRPSNASLCDYYASMLYGENNCTTQTKLVQSIVSLAFGGPGNLTNLRSDLTGF